MDRNNKTKYTTKFSLLFSDGVLDINVQFSKPTARRGKIEINWSQNDV